MYVNHSGWNQERGAFCYNIFVDENRRDYAIEFGNGYVSKQMSSFQEVTTDWNRDGDVYTQFGAWFESSFGGNDFWTPEDMVAAAIEAMDADRRIYDNDVKAVHGIDIPLRENRKSFVETLRDSEVRAANQDADRNRRMNAMGIRPPNEPWAR